MKKDGVLFVLAAIALFPIQTFASAAEQAQGKAEAPALIEVAPPDISKLHLARKEFFVARGYRDGWTAKEEDGDAELLVSEAFSENELSERIVAGALYPSGSAKPCAFFFFGANGDKIFALVLEDGKIVTARGGKVGFQKIADEKGGVAGVRVFLHYGDDPNDNEKKLAERKFMFAK